VQNTGNKEASVGDLVTFELWKGTTKVDSWKMPLGQKLIPGTSVKVEHSFAAPDTAGEYKVKSKIDAAEPGRQKTLEVVSPVRITADEYGMASLFVVVVVIPLVAYFFLKQKEEE
jgi:hypothetical protein